MYCPGCGVENIEESVRFCRSCGANLLAVSQAMTMSLPVKIASSVDAYLENRYQQNLRPGVVNLIAFVALLAVGLGHLTYGWTRLGLFMLGLSVLSLLFGAWDIWIFRRNLPPVANRSALPSTPEASELNAAPSEPIVPHSVVEPTTRNLELHRGEVD